MNNNLSYFIALTKVNMKSAFSLKFVFFFRMVLMAVNNFIMLLCWWVLFQKFPEINGWKTDDLMLMFGMTNFSASIYIIFFRGFCEKQARYILNGELDTFLLQPKNTVMSMGASASDPSGFGDMLTGIIIFALSSYVTWQTLPMLAVIVTCTAVVMCSMALFCGCAAFFSHDGNEIALRGFHAFMSLTLQPNSIFTGLSKVLIFTILPAGFIAFLPVELFRDFSWTGLGALVLGTAVIFTIAVKTFYFGLSRYESGNRFGVKG